MATFKDLTGMRFGKLHVNNRSMRKGKAGEVYWECLCDCGSETVATSQNLNAGNKISCGSYQCRGFPDMVGKKIWKLVVISRVNNSDHEGARWLCKCECGKECVIYGKKLRSPRPIKSCGCYDKEIHSRQMAKMNRHYLRIGHYSTCQYCDARFRKKTRSQIYCTRECSSYAAVSKGFHISALQFLVTHGDRLNERRTSTIA